MDINLHIELNNNNSVNSWLDAQADRVGAKGHIGTHLDCYTSAPQQREHTISTYIIDCRKAMPDDVFCQSLPMLNGKGLVLYTSNMEFNEYGSESYLSKSTFLSKRALSIIIEKSPKFILIDSHGIGTHGKEHIEYDKLCESIGCHVIENIHLDSELVHTLKEIKITIDIDNISTGKPCLIYSI